MCPPMCLNSSDSSNQKPAAPKPAKSVWDQKAEENMEWARENKVNCGSCVLGIGGGVGPLAGVGLHTRIIEHTITDGTDQSHFQVVHVSASSSVQDRTKFLLGQIEENPGEGMADVVNAIAACAKASKRDSVCVAVPCNTFHAPPIWNRFEEKLKELDLPQVRLVHMLGETVHLITELAPSCKKVGLLSTTGTRQSRVYHDLLEPAGFQVIEVEESVQSEVHEAIYNPEWGIKAVSPVTERASIAFKRFADALVAAGAESIILGCTEIPLALPGWFHGRVPLVDPVVAAARGLIRLGDASKLRPLPSPKSPPATPRAEPDQEPAPLLEYCTMPKPSALAWNLPAEGPTFNADYATEFRPSSVADAGLGWWASADIPAGTLVRRVTVADGSLLKFRTPAELFTTGWDLDDAVNYGIGHWQDPQAICFLKPGTPVKHADPSRTASVRYCHNEFDALEIWTTRDIEAGEEMFSDHTKDYAPCAWYDRLIMGRGNLPLAHLARFLQTEAGAELN